MLPHKALASLILLATSTIASPVANAPDNGLVMRTTPTPPTFCGAKVLVCCNPKDSKDCVVYPKGLTVGAVVSAWCVPLAAFCCNVDGKGDYIVATCQLYF